MTSVIRLAIPGLLAALLLAGCMPRQAPAPAPAAALPLPAARTEPVAPPPAVAPQPLEPVPAPAPPPPPPPVVKKMPPPMPKAGVRCSSRRTGKGDDEKTQISCSNTEKTPQLVFLKIEAIGVSGIPTLATERAGHKLGPGETQVLATLGVISRPYSVRFSHTSKPAP